MGLSFPGTGAQFTKVWENPNPNGNFAGQVVQMDLSNYDAVLILQRAGTSLWIRVGQDAIDTSANIWANGQIGASYDLKSRRYYTSTTKITFSDCLVTYGGSGNVETQNNWHIPIAVYGVNFGG